MSPVTLPDVDTDSYLRNPALAWLEGVIRKWKPLARKCAAAVRVIEDEKTLRNKDIAPKLVEAGIERNQVVTCQGYEVILRGQAGRASLNEQTLIELIVEKYETTADEAQRTINAAKTLGEPSTWVEIRPMKGAKLRR